MRANYFRVENTHTREEYMQEAYAVYLRVRNKYAETVTEPQHFMSLFKRAWTNELNDLATKATRHRMFVQMPTIRSEDGDELDYEPVGELNNEGMLATLIRQAPRDVAMVMNLFLSAPQELLELALASWREDARSNRGSQHICRLLGLDPSTDVMRRVEEHFSPLH